MDYKIIDIPLDQLLVNPENYRFDPVSNQKEAMRVILDDQKIKIVKLGMDIAVKGLNPTSLLNVMKNNDDSFVLLDGNRRITALKLIDNPNLIGEYPLKRIFQNLHHKYAKTIPIKIKCAVYPSENRDIAERWVLLEHTGENQGVSTVRWNNEQIERFKSRHKKKELPKSLQIIDYLNSNNIITKDVDSTTLDRIISTPEVREIIGIEFLDQRLSISKKKKDTLSNLQKIINEMQKKEFKVSDVYTVEKRIVWIRQLLNNDSKKGEIITNEEKSSILQTAHTIPNDVAEKQKEIIPLQFPIKNIRRKPLVYSSEEAEQVIEFIFSRFPELAQKLKKRRKVRPPLLFNDEYDVQYSLYGLLAMHFEDVRDEEWIPSYAGTASRMDFLVQNEEVVVEAKMTRKGLADKQISSQLIIDIAKYEKHPKCKKLFCFVYDPTRRIENDAAIMNDLRSKRGRMPKVRVFIEH